MRYNFARYSIRNVPELANFVKAEAGSCSAQYIGTFVEVHKVGRIAIFD